MKPAKSTSTSIGAPSCSFKEDRQNDNDATERVEDVRMHNIKEPLAYERFHVEVAAKLDGNPMTDDQTNSDPKPPCALHVPYGHVLGRRFVPNQAQDLPKMIPDWYLNGHASLQQAGQCIETELEVAMLYMQRRLDKVNLCVEFYGRHCARFRRGNPNNLET